MIISSYFFLIFEIIKLNSSITIPGNGGILLRFLSGHLENPEHHSLVMSCDTPTPKDIRLSNFQQTTNPLIARPLSADS